MSKERPEMNRDSLLRRVLIPKGYRPVKSESIDKMLSLESEPMSDEKYARMLRKINGQEPIFPEHSDAVSPTITELTEVERELVALHRAQNKPLPPDLAAKLKAMESRTSKPTHGEQESTGG